MITLYKNHLNKFIHSYVRYVIIFDRQHVEAAQDAIFSFPESDEAVKTSDSVGFQEMHALPRPLQASHNFYHA